MRSSAREESNLGPWVKKTLLYPELQAAVRIIATDFAVVLLITLVVMSCTACAALDQKPQVKPETFTTAQTPVPIKCIKDEDVPTYPNLTTFDTEKSSPKQVSAANAADLQAFKLYADAARDQLAKCTKGISP